MREENLLSETESDLTVFCTGLGQLLVSREAVLYMACAAASAGRLKGIEGELSDLENEIARALENIRREAEERARRDLLK